MKELHSCSQMGDMFHQESGQLMKLVGVFRALDVLWNPDKKYVFLLNVKQIRDLLLF
jgi:hypothetical protein